MKATQLILFYILIILSACSKKHDSGTPTPTQPPGSFHLLSSTINGGTNTSFITANAPTFIRFAFDAPVDGSNLSGNILWNESTGAGVNFTTSLSNGDSVILLKSSMALKELATYTITVSSNIASKQKVSLQSSTTLNLTTGIDSSDKFPTISDNALLDLVQQQTFKYFWDFGHPVSGLARERNTSGEVVTTGGSGFGIMAIVTAISRGFISRADGLARLQKMVNFLKNTAQTFYGAYPHWLNGTTGAVVPFSAKDDGADLVETSYLVQGLLTARQFFNTTDGAETALRADINFICDKVEWSFFRKGSEDVLYWHWSPNYGWDMNVQIQGWNEALITYVLAASSTKYPITKTVYDNGWAKNGAIKNGNTYYGYVLPLGPANGGPLFFEHYSFLGINPKGLTDNYASYETQTTNHAKINYEYCKANPLGYYGYSSLCWGLTASDVPNGYTASSPTNDVGVIAPTAALSSFPYTPVESMNALKFFYYTLGDKIWKEYGFVDAFSLKDRWFASSFLAIDQGPIICMIENYRSGLLWNLFMSCPEVKAGMKSLGFQSPKL